MYLYASLRKFDHKVVMQHGNNISNLIYRKTFVSNSLQKGKNNVKDI